MYNYNITCKKISIFLHIDKQKLFLYTIKKKEGFLLSFRIWGNGTEIFDTFLPPPNIHKWIDDKSYIISWLLEGYFLTKKNQKFLDDIIKKIIETLEKFGTLRVEWIGWVNIAKLNDSDIIHLNAYNLRDDIAPYLEYKQNKTDYRALELLASATEYKESDDAFFDWLRFKVYDFVKENGKNALTLDYCRELAIIGYEIMGHKKGISTPLAKAKSIYNWVMENYNPKGKNWNYVRKFSDEEYEMTRREHIIKINKQKAKKTKEKVYYAIKQLKEKGEKISIRKVMQEAQVSKSSVEKYLKQAREEGII